MELNNFKYNKKYGQNFIFDTNLLNAIVCDSGITKEDEVLEIGPGAGTLTKIIAKYAKKVVSYEIDENLKEILTENLKEINNSKIIFKDALKTDIKETISNVSRETLEGKATKKINKMVKNGQLEASNKEEYIKREIKHLKKRGVKNDRRK